MIKANEETRELKAAALFGLIIAAAIDADWLFTLFPCNNRENSANNHDGF